MDNAKILLKHLQWAVAHYSEHIDFTPTGPTLTKWMGRIRGLDGHRTDDHCLRHAEILIEFDTTRTIGSSKDTAAPYPYAPPTFVVHTPNGLYQTGTKVCVGQGEYHSQNYDQSLGVGGFAMYLMSGLSMADKPNLRDGSIGISRQTADATEQRSKKSRAYNLRQHAAINKKLDVQMLAMLASGLWRPGDVPRELVKTYPAADQAPRYKKFAMRVAAWAASAHTEVQDISSSVHEILGEEPTPADPGAYCQLLSAVSADYR